MNKMDWKKYKLIVFDLDNTLAKSKIPIDSEMSKILAKLLEIKKVAVISGGGFLQIQKEVLNPLSVKSNFSNLYIFPTDGNAYYTWKNIWHPVYINSLSKIDKNKIEQAVRETLIEIEFKEKNTRGELLEDRESSMVFSALGQNALLEDKQKWDPDKKKRFEIKRILDQKLPDFEISVAGTTSIDITPKGINKAYGIKKMVEYIKVPIEKMVFVGDALFEGGNDNSVIETGIDTMSVENPEETKKIIKEII